MNKSTNDRYWNEYYKRKSDYIINFIPSKFCIFTINELIDKKISNIIEFECGTGRDSCFFSKYKFKVIGFDKSLYAIKKK